MAKTFTETHGDIREVMKTMLDVEGIFLGRRVSREGEDAVSR